MIVALSSHKPSDRLSPIELKKQPKFEVTELTEKKYITRICIYLICSMNVDFMYVFYLKMFKFIWIYCIFLKNDLLIWYNLPISVRSEPQFRCHRWVYLRLQRPVGDWSFFLKRIRWRIKCYIIFCFFIPPKIWSLFFLEGPP